MIYKILCFWCTLSLAPVFPHPPISDDGYQAIAVACNDLLSAGKNLNVQIVAIPSINKKKLFPLLQLGKGVKLVTRNLALDDHPNNRLVSIMDFEEHNKTYVVDIFYAYASLAGQGTVYTIRYRDGKFEIISKEPGLK